jgi:hypothetical protein
VHEASSSGAEIEEFGDLVVGVAIAWKG